MNELVLFAGTAEGRQLAEYCRGRNVQVWVCVATEYGEALIEETENIHVLAGRKDRTQMLALLEQHPDCLVIDATHPYAPGVTASISEACAEAGRAYVRVLRAEEHAGTEHCIFVGSSEEAVDYLSRRSGNILLTVGSKELARYACIAGCQERVFARILPMAQALEHAAALGFTGRHLICMQGPFTKEMNAAMLKMLDIQYLVTKDTGSVGGFPEKLAAAAEAGVQVLVIRRPTSEQGISLSACMDMLQKCCGFAPGKQVTIVGIGAGSAGTMTVECVQACRQAELLIGAGRITDGLAQFGKPTVNAVTAPDVERAVRNAGCSRIVIAMSGDTGFYSGTKKLLPRLADLSVRVLPGISSVVYFCSRLGIAWDDALLISTHGRACNYLAKIRKNPKVLALTGGETSAQSILKALCENGMGHVRVTVGENLSYENESIRSGSAAEIAGEDFGPLSVLLAENPDAESAVVTHGKPDDSFIRAQVPMTKQEVRAVTLSRLRLTKDAVCWDVGAGTGSVSLEMADCCEDGKVYAIERKPEACELIERNKRHLGISNVEVVSGAAPEALAALPAPTHVFIGGSGGNLREIIAYVLEKNPNVRIVINTVTVESLSEALACLKTMEVGGLEITELSAARARKAGSSHLMTAQNPVFILSCTGGAADA